MRLPPAKLGWVLLAIFALSLWAQAPPRAGQAPGIPPVVEWGPDGKILLSSNQLVARFDLDSGAEELLDRYGDTFAISPGGTSLAVARGKVVEVRSYPKLIPEFQVWPPEGAVVTALGWVPDSQTMAPSATSDSERAVLAAGTHDGRLLLWSLEAGELVTDFPTGEAAPLARLRFSADGTRLLAVFEPGQALLLDLTDRSSSASLHRYPAVLPGEDEAAAAVEVLDLHPRGRRVLLTRKQNEGSEIIVLDDAGQLFWRRPGYAQEFTRDGNNILALAWPFRLAAAYRTTDGQAVRTFEPPPEVHRLLLLRQSPDGESLLAVGEDNRTQVLLLWDFETGRLKAVHR